MQTAALSVIEFLHRVYDVFHEYFGEVRRTHGPRPFFFLAAASALRALRAPTSSAPSSRCAGDAALADGQL
jgi:hypothetical protein